MPIAWTSGSFRSGREPRTSSRIDGPVAGRPVKVRRDATTQGGFARWVSEPKRSMRSGRRRDGCAGHPRRSQMRRTQWFVSSRNNASASRRAPARHARRMVRSRRKWHWSVRASSPAARLAIGLKCLRPAAGPHPLVGLRGGVAAASSSARSRPPSTLRASRWARRAPPRRTPAVGLGHGDARRSRRTRVAGAPRRDPQLKTGRSAATCSPSSRSRRTADSASARAGASPPSRARRSAASAATSVARSVNRRLRSTAERAASAEAAAVRCAVSAAFAARSAATLAFFAAVAAAAAAVRSPRRCFDGGELPPSGRPQTGQVPTDRPARAGQAGRGHHRVRGVVVEQARASAVRAVSSAADVPRARLPVCVIRLRRRRSRTEARRPLGEAAERRALAGAGSAADSASSAGSGARSSSRPASRSTRCRRRRWLPRRSVALRFDGQLSTRSGPEPRRRPRAPNGRAPPRPHAPPPVPPPRPSPPPRRRPPP
jgi:hypothetical protein